VRDWVQVSNAKLYWRLLTPLVILWGFIFQRLNANHTCDAAVSHLHTGAADGLVPPDPVAGPLSQRLTSESTSAYVQGRNRLPLSVLQAALRHVLTVLLGWLRAQAANQTGPAHWVIVRSLAAFCGFSQALVAYAEAPTATSETALVRRVMEQDPEPHSVYVSDRNFGTFRVAQVARACHQHLVTRLNARTAQVLFRSVQPKGTLRSGADLRVAWAPQPKALVEPDLPTTPVAGRLLYVRLERQGFRALDLYLFTTLLDLQQHPLEDLVALYGLRWEVEIDYRHIKTTLEMDEFTSKSPDLFRKELAAGLLTYNLICALMAKAALKANLAPTQLSFSRCYRRIRALLMQGVPGWVIAQGDLEGYVLDRLAQCTLPHQPNKVAHEPRRVRRRPAVFPALKGSRQAARQQVVQDLAGQPKS